MTIRLLDRDAWCAWLFIIGAGFSGCCRSQACYVTYLSASVLGHELRVDLVAHRFVQANDSLQLLNGSGLPLGGDRERQQ